MRSPFDPLQAVSNTMFYGMDTARALQRLYTCVDTYAFVYILEPLHDEHNNSKATMWEAGGGLLLWVGGSVPRHLKLQARVEDARTRNP